MLLNEAETRTKLIDPAIHARGYDLKAVKPLREKQKL